VGSIILKGSFIFYWDSFGKGVAVIDKPLAPHN